ncbi:hypothetical protein O0L34_g14997 [Tuta absoluta]|nr:hypothetical protein O0L34_g14997 [Tuta absoluta]
MPKVLSLKKSKGTVPPKNQKSITSFFKNTNSTSTQNQQKSPAKSQASHSNGLEKKVLKRKATSPALIETVEILDDDFVESTPITSSLQANGHHTPKKLKSDNNVEDETSKTKHVIKKSPAKENNVNGKTPKVKEINENHVIHNEMSEEESGMRSPLTPIKSSHCVPRAAILKTPEKLSQKELSPSKSGSTVKTQELSPNTLLDGFGDQWDVDDVDENIAENLDLSTLQRCEVMSVIQHQGRLELRLKNDDNNKGTCFVEGVWLDTPLSSGDIISVIASRNTSGHFFVGNSAGLLVLRPDHLISSTSVVGGVFCRRKAVLQERYRGLDAGNTAMTIGILIHELVQKALTENIMDIAALRAETNRIIKESIQMLYDCGIEEEEARTNMQQYLPSLAEFMQTYVAKSPLSKQPQKEQWKGRIDKVLDIEENLCCPQLGLKGKIDATLQVTVHEGNGRQRSIVPLELKSGKASVSAEHRGQLVLYGMMLSVMRNEDPTTASNSGLLLYLKERVDVRSVSCGFPERRDLLLLRNQLVSFLSSGPQDVDTEELTDIEDAASLLQQRLPEPVHHRSACAKCPYLTLCQLHLWHTDGPSVPESHPLSQLQGTALGHLSPAHIEYFLHWSALLRIEEKSQMHSAPLHALWTDSIQKRSKRGTCAANLKLNSVEPLNDRYLHCFERQLKEIDSLNSHSKSTSGPQEGEFSIVSIDGRPWIAAGVVTLANDKQIQIVLERDLSRRLAKDTAFHIDTYESYASTVQNLTNLGVLLEDSERSARLRRLIIDKEPPEFARKLPRDVGRLGSKLMRSLNIEQQRAVLSAVAAKHHALLRGLPGTGKTQTISVLIQMLVGLKQRVLVTAHTHSAVDNVLSRLPETVRVLRLGSASRVADTLKNKCEQEMVGKCENVKQLEDLYNSMEVVGVTCLGAAHPLLRRRGFDVCVVDEATQLPQCTALRPLLAADRFVLVGDPDQLPPVVRSRAARRLGMEESLFHRLMTEDATSTLQLQYRMNQPLVDIANKVAYSGKLKCADARVAEARLDIDEKKVMELPAWLQSACSPSPEHAALFLDVTSTETPTDGRHCTNVEEACVLMAIVEAMIQGGVKPSDIGVIAAYREQVCLLRRALLPRAVECSTVDQFQGRDKPLILYSCTKRGDAQVKEGEILNDQRRLAVSVTRAKHKLIIVGNALALQRYKPLQRLIEACTPLPLDKQEFNSVLEKYKKEFV